MLHTTAERLHGRDGSYSSGPADGIPLSADRAFTANAWGARPNADRRSGNHATQGTNAMITESVGHQPDPTAMTPRTLPKPSPRWRDISFTSADDHTGPISRIRGSTCEAISIV